MALASVGRLSWKEVIAEAAPPGIGPVGRDVFLSGGAGPPDAGV